MRPRAGIRDKIRPARPLPHSPAKKLTQHRPSSRVSAKKFARHAINRQFRAIFRAQGELFRAHTHHQTMQGELFRATDAQHGDFEPTTPLQPLIQASMKPPSPLHAPKQRPLKPPSPLQPKTTPKTPISHPQRRWRFHLRLALRPQRRCRSHTRDLRCPRAMVGPGRGAGGWRQGQGGPRDRPLRAAGSRVAISRAGRRPPAHTAAGPSGARNTRGATSNARTPARHSKRGRHQPTPCASALTHP